MQNLAQLSLRCVIVFSLAMLGCNGSRETHQGVDARGLDAEVDAFVPVYPEDERLRVNHLQALGTHNSYHLRSQIDILPWRYNHRPLDEQLDEQGVRQFELDLYQNEDGVLEVYHIETVDDGTTCATLTDCLSVMKVWSDTHPGHHPLLVLLETKRYRESPAATIERIESVLSEVWTRDRLLTPDLVQRDAMNLRDGIREYGWPSLGEVRGRLLAVLHTGGALREAYLNAEGGTAERLMFPDAYGDLEVPFAAYHSMNDPVGGQARIQRVVNAGHLVRTRADADGVESEALDYTKANAALTSGAHFISTDYPTQATETTYGFLIPEGTPSRCNPISAPMVCTSADLENPTALGPATP